MSDALGKPRAVVLVSGGLDSATTLAIALAEGFECHALTVDYGQRHRIEIDYAATQVRAQRAAAHRVARVDLGFVGGSALTDRAIDVPKSAPDAPIEGGIPVTYVPARNTVLLAVALAWAEVLEAERIYTGVNAVDYSGYPDCRPAFVEAFERLADQATRAGVGGRRVRVVAPLIDLDKCAIVRRALELGVDVGSTVSCYDPSGRGEPCGGCDACRLRAKGFRDAGAIDPRARDRR